MKKIKIFSLATGLIVWVGFTGTVFARTQIQTLGNLTSSTTKTDKYVVSCGSPAARLAIQVYDKPTNPELGTKLTISAKKVSVKACSASSTDTNDNDLKYSAWAFCNGGAGDYVMTITKPAWVTTGRENYIAQFYCLDTKGNEAPIINYSQIQNQ